MHLSPQDFDLVRAELEADASYRGCRFVADPAVGVGGCRVDTPQGQIDATLATRWRRVIATLGAEHPAPFDAAEGADDAPRP